MANSGNKQQLIAVLLDSLQTVGVVVVRSLVDADTDVASQALMTAREANSDVIVYADDTDILVLMLHHLDDSMHDIIFISNQRAKGEARQTESALVFRLFSKTG
jgi:hypothetical protein